MRVCESKDPAETVDYGVDWSAVLQSGETFDAVAWSVPAGLTEGARSAAEPICRIFLSGGTLGTFYDVENTITTSAGRVYRETLRIYIRRR
jgi:hypothetical protein